MQQKGLGFGRGLSRRASPSPGEFQKRIERYIRRSSNRYSIWRELRSCSYCCLACSSTNLHVEVWSRGRSRRNVLQPSQWEGGKNCSAPVAKQTCKPVPKPCEDEFTDDLSRRARRAVSFVQMGEFSIARQALEGAQLAPGTSAPRESLERDEEHVPVERVELDKELSLINLRTARKRAAAAGK